MKKLYNQKSKELLVKKLESEDFNRITCSFYNYVTIVDPLTFRDKVYEEFLKLADHQKEVNDEDIPKIIRACRL